MPAAPIGQILSEGMSGMTTRRDHGLNRGIGAIPQRSIYYNMAGDQVPGVIPDSFVTTSNSYTLSSALNQ